MARRLPTEPRTPPHPFTPLPRRAGKRFPMRQLLTLLDHHGVAAVVVGLPLAADGSEGPPARQARALADDIGRRSGRPVELWDERMTTAPGLQAARGLGGWTCSRTESVIAL